MEKPKTKNEAENYILGMITGLNKARLLVWGIGYDNDVTALMLRKTIMDEIYNLKEILEIKIIGDSYFDSATRFIKSLNDKQDEQ